MVHSFLDSAPEEEVSELTPGNFASALKRARQKKKLTISAVSELTGIVRPIYSLIESGRLYPDHEKQEALCKVLEFTWPDERRGDLSAVEG